jgi:N-carbamoyl-L-amino-acid hydrolase
VTDVAATFDELWSRLALIGRTSSGGYRRFAWTDADRQARAWFVEAATSRGLDVRPDRNGNLWAWWWPEGHAGPPRDAVVTGSHLDSVPDGGAFDGPLGVVSALCAVDAVRSRGVELRRPLGVVVFADEEGSRFGVACAGSRLLTGELAPERAAALTDADGVRLRDAMAAAGVDVSELGRDDELLRGIGRYVELHIEQGRALGDLGAAVGIGTGIGPHGRWRFSFTGKADHAGTTRLADRHDPMLPFAASVVAARDAAARHGGLATFGRATIVPNATNAVASVAEAWLDARAPTQGGVDAIVADTEAAARAAAAAESVAFACTPESLTPAVAFDPGVCAELTDVLRGAPLLDTGAGHDAGVLSSAGVPAGMVFVRNPTGVSHAPDEFAERADCLAGVEALADVIVRWAGR